MRRVFNSSATPIKPHMKQLLDTEVSNGIGCSRIQNGEAIRQHKHFDSLKQAWSLGGRCTWPQCASKAVFKTRASFKMHFTNIHTHPLLCLIVDCSQKTPFGRLSDLSRHQQSAHSVERKFACSVVSCDARIKEFARKDHLTKHMRERHDNYFCPMNHCPRGTKSSFAKPEDLAEHINNEHGIYECALQGCEHMPSSKFSFESLNNHLRNHHEVSRDVLLYSDLEMPRSGRTFQEADLGKSHRRKCKTCEKRAHTTE